MAKSRTLPKHLFPPVTQVFLLDQSDQSSSVYDAGHPTWVLTKEGWTTLLPGGRHMSVPHVLAHRDVEQKLVQALVRLAKSTFHQHSSKREVTGNLEAISAIRAQHCKWVIASDDGFWEGPGVVIRSQYMPAKSALVFPGHPEDNGLISYASNVQAKGELYFGLMVRTLPWLISGNTRKILPRGGSLNFDCP